MRKFLRWPLWIALGAIGLYLFWALSPYLFGGSPIRWTTVTKDVYPGEIEIHREDLHEVFAFMLAPHVAELRPFHHVEKDHEQVVFVAGRERVRFTRPLVTIYPSPTGQYIVAEDDLFTNPPIIYHSLSNTKFSWDKWKVEKELPGNPYMVTFQFVKWENDDHFLLEVGGQGFPGCRQTWSVDAKSGSHEMSASTSRPAVRPWG